jgi:hypothetical protein
MPYSGDGAPAWKNNRQSTPATSQKAARGGAGRRSALPLARSRVIWVLDWGIAGSSPQAGLFNEPIVTGSDSSVNEFESVI